MDLELSAGCVRSELIKELRALDPRILIFLRRLRRIKIEIIEDNRSTWTSNLNRIDPRDGGDLTIQLRHNDEVLHYMISNHRVSSLPPVKERLGISDSEILLAFPVSNHVPKLDPQQVFAFLPIRPYGFMVSDQAIGKKYHFSLSVVPSTSRLSSHCQSRRY